MVVGLHRADEMPAQLADEICNRCGESDRETSDPESDVWQQTDGQPEAATVEPPDLHQLVHQRLRTTMDTRGREPEDEARPRTNCR